MSLRDRFFKPRWQHRDAEVRAAAVATDNDEELRRQLPQIAREDSAVAVRRAALQRLSKLENLLPCALAENDAELRQEARRRVLPLLLKSAHSSAELEQLVRDWDDPKVQEQVATQAHHAALRRLAIGLCQRQGLLGQCASTDPEAANRALALARIEQASTLKQVAERLRRSDKQLYRQAMARLAALAGGDHVQREHAERLCQQAEQLARGVGVHALAQQMQDLEQAWQQLAWQHAEDDPPAVALQRRFQGALDILRKALAGPSATPAAIPEAPTAPAEPAPSAATDTATSASSAAAGGTHSAQTTTPPEPHEDADQDTDQSAEERPPRPALVALQQQLQQLQAQARDGRLPHSALARWQRQWDKARENHKARGTTTQSGKPAAPSTAEQALVQQTQQLLQTLQEQLAAQRQQREQAHAQLAQHLTALQQALDQDHLATAARAESACLACLRQHRLRPPRQWRELRAKLDELRRWQRWSNNQQRKQLIADVDALKDSELHPDALLQRLREAREAWQHLDEQERACGLRGGHGAWPRFNNACNAVMEHIKPFLEKRHHVREERAEVLRERVTQGQQALAAADLPHGELLKQRRALVGALRELAGVPRQQRQELAQHVRDLLNQVDERLKTLEQAAIADKQRLIKQAAALHEVEPLGEAIKQAIALQKDWRGAGHLRRGKEQRLWKEFRSHMDPLFAKLDDNRAQREAAQQEREQEWEQWVAGLEQLAGEAAAMDEITPLKALWHSQRQQWQDARVHNPQLQQRWQQAADKIEARLQELRTAAARSAHVEHWQVCEQWLQWASDALAGTAQEPPADASEDQRALTALPAPELENALQQRSDRAVELCIAIEYLAGLDSPAADQEARLHYQVERLASRLGKGEPALTPREELAGLEARWFALQPVHPQRYAALAQRFRAAWEVAVKAV